MGRLAGVVCPVQADRGRRGDGIVERCQNGVYGDMGEIREEGRRREKNVEMGIIVSIIDFLVLAAFVLLLLKH